MDKRRDWRRELDGTDAKSRQAEGLTEIGLKCHIVTPSVGGARTALL